MHVVVWLRSPRYAASGAGGHLVSVIRAGAFLSGLRQKKGHDRSPVALGSERPGRVNIDLGFPITQCLAVGLAWPLK